MCDLLDHTRRIIDHQDPETADPNGWHDTTTRLAAEARSVELGGSGVGWETLDERIKQLERSCLSLALHFAWWRRERKRLARRLQPVEIDDAPFREIGEEIRVLLCDSDPSAEAWVAPEAHDLPASEHSPNAPEQDHLALIDDVWRIDLEGSQDRADHDFCELKRVWERIQNATGKQSGRKPYWNERQRELTWNGVVIKRYKRNPAKNQVDLLEAFQRVGWPATLPDPFDDARKLNQTISDLNDALPEGTVSFHGDGSGDGVDWRGSPPAE
jgi:hypothetical protein